MAEAPRQTTIRDFLAVVFRRKWIILGLFAIATGTVLTVNLASPALYESTARVLVERGERQGVFEPGVKLLSREEDIASEVELVRSEPVLKQAQAILDARRRTSGQRRLVLSAGDVYGAVLGESNVIEVNYQDRNPRIVQEAANAVTDAYVAFHERIRSLPAVDSFLTGQLTSTRDQLAYWQNARTRFMQSNSMVASDAERQYLLRDVDDQRMALAEQDRDIVTAARKVQEAEKLKGGMDVPFTSGVSIGGEVTILEMKQALNGAQSELADLSQRYAPTAEPVAAARAKVDRLQKALEGEVANRVQLMSADLEVLRARRAATLRAMGEMEQRLRTYPGRAQAVADMDRIINMLTVNYNELNAKLLQAQINRASTSPSWQVTKLTPASWPRAKNTKDYVRLALAPILSLAVGLGLAFFVESLDHSIATASAVEDGLGIPLLASVREVR